MVTRHVAPSLCQGYRVNACLAMGIGVVGAKNARRPRKKKKSSQVTAQLLFLSPRLPRVLSHARIINQSLLRTLQPSAKRRTLRGARQQPPPLHVQCAWARQVGATQAHVPRARKIVDR